MPSGGPAAAGPRVFVPARSDHCDRHRVPHAVTLGFLSLAQDAAGHSGGYLVTNAWGRPLEFRLSSAVQPTKVQQILYGPTLADYLQCELIGKTLVEKAGNRRT